ncbi:MAG: PAS domain S-box protein [Proteobacteria bacterium]|nr:PAS domain S-box protein [Pseudomonadota bacterium]
MTAGNDEHSVSDLIGNARAKAFANEARAAFLLGRDGALIGANGAARDLFDTGLPTKGPAPGASRLRGFLARATAGDTLADTVRFFVGGRMESLRMQALAFDLDDDAVAGLVVFGEGAAPTLPPRAVAKLEPAPAGPAPALAAPVIAALDAEKPIRFVFLTDHDGHFISLSPAFLAATGATGRQLIGQSLVDVVAGSGAEAAGQIARALLTRTSFSGLDFDWPPEGEVREAVVELSGNPQIGPDGTLIGYSGVGLFRRGTAVSVPQPAAEVPASALPSAASVIVTNIDSRDEDPAVDTDGYEKAIARLQSALDSNDADDEAEATETNGTLSLDFPSLDDLETEEVDEMPVEHAVEAPALPDVPVPAVSSRTDHPPARQDNGHPAGETVVPLRTLRTQIGASLGEQKIIPLKSGVQPPHEVSPQDGVSQRLSHAERNAFREIAKALGARIEEQDSGAETPAAQPVVPAKASEPTPAANHVAAAQAEITKALAAAHEHQDRGLSVRGVSGQGEHLGDVIIDRMPVGVLVFRGDKPKYMNKSLLDLLSYRDLAEFDALRGLEKLFRGRAAPSFTSGEFDTVTIMGRDGETMPVDAHLQAIDWNGEHATMVTFRRAVEAEQGPRLRSLDVELKARQAELAEARAMLDTATDGVISLDEAGRILALNKSAEALFGYDQNELTGERLTLLLAPESHAAALDYIDGLKTGGVASVLNDGREVVGRERKGGRIPMFMTIGRISETGKFAAVLRDLTAWKRAESELTEAKRAAERSSALKSDFLAKVSHEIRTPMSAIIGFAEVMRDERLGPIGTERYKDYLKDIHTSGEHVISLVNDLLDLSKVEAGRMELSFGSVDLNAIVTSCLGIMQPQANRDRVIMRSQLSAKLPPVVADERSIRQIILNLLSNASKFTEPGGQVIVSTALSDNGEAVIRVRDTGVGMTEAEVQAALEPFRQLSNARGRGGTGLGLPLTKALVEANRAHFSIKSKTREGTLVEITFPPTRVLAE